MDKRVVLAVFLLAIRVNGRYVYRGVKLFECESYDRQNCDQIYPGEKHFLIQTGTKVISKDMFTNKSDLLSVIGTPADIEDVQQGCFTGLKKLRRIYLGGQRLQNIPYGVFNDLPVEYLYLAGNFLRTIETDAFDMKNLERMYLDRNYLTYFDPNWFAAGVLKSLKFLHMHHNRVRAINRKAFYKFPQLLVIDFSFNEVEYISNDIFNHQADINHFLLKHNKIKTLGTNILKTVNYIDNLSLSYNFLKSISCEFIDKTIINKIEIHPNQWVCSCLKKFEQKLQEKNIEPHGGEDQSLLCYDTEKKCEESEKSMNMDFEISMNNTYENLEKHCQNNKDSEEGHLCRSDFCWPLLLRSYVHKTDENYFFCIYY
ncbi:unnamed protein product [Brassicogethes aeneus]|uniref:Uncharacterized protein n=1 Tax=Brassicogethes aeneus TaxID=1431903 RepID=A0A9P0FJT6_BRAAE|nr:unnamed protein product [Brassicogethes aeneus]